MQNSKFPYLNFIISLATLAYTTNEFTMKWSLERCIALYTG